MHAQFNADRIEGMSLTDAIKRTAHLVSRKGDTGEASVSWERNRGVRFRLLAEDGSPASFDLHDRFIEAIYDLAPDARIRTARALYESRADFQMQVRASMVPNAREG